MELTKEIKEILENVVYWDTCPKDYKEKINAYLKSVNESEALSIHDVSQQSELLIDFAKWWDINTEYWEDINYPKTVKKYIESINCG